MISLKVSEWTHLTLGGIATAFQIAMQMESY